MTTLRHFFLMLALLCFCCACAAEGQTADESGSPALPDIDALDNLRGSSATDLSANLQQQFLSAGSGWNGSEVTLSPGPAALAYCIYRFDPADDSELLNIFAAGEGELWLVIADYASGRWGRSTEFSGGNAQVALGGLPGMLSPAGYFYAAIVAPQNGEGRSGTLSELTLTIEDETIPGPTFYVAPPASGGDDENPGSSEEPWATLQHAADVAVAGDTIIVRPGEYSGMMIQRSGAPGQYIRFLAEPGAEITDENPTTPDGINIENWEGTLSYVWVEGFTISGMQRAGIRAAHDPSNGPYPHHITIKDNICRDNGVWGILTGFINDALIEGNTCSGSLDEHGIYVSNSGDGTIVRGNTCYGNAACGLHNNGDASLGGDGTLSNMIIEYNVLYDNGGGSEVNPQGGGAAINLDGVRDSIIRGNLLYNNHAGGISNYEIDGASSGNNLILNNTIVMPADGRWCVHINDSSPGNVLLNNIFWSEHNFRGAIEVSGASLVDLVSNHNVTIGRFNIDDEAHDLAEWRVATGQDLDSTEDSAANVFVNAAAFDFRLQDGCSAEDIGTSHAELPDVDIAGLTRPQGAAIDAGAYELQP